MHWVVRAQHPPSFTSGPFVDVAHIHGSSGSGLVMKPAPGMLSLMSVSQLERCIPIPG